ncbi:MAG: FecR family protein [Candidatus Cryptobacteroides sp.]|nr:FecR domain-containing protein [Bacteroidales bacterium]
MIEKLKDYYNGLLSEEESLKVRQWLVENENDPQVDAFLLKLMSGGDTQSNEEKSADQAFGKVASELGIASGITDRRRLIVKRITLAVAGAAACLLLPLAGIFTYSKMETPVEWRELKVPYGTTAEITLSDGTHLDLNSGSRITYPAEFKGKERRVFVEGEVLAEVAKNPDKPFIIQSGDVGVTVLGTKFNYKAYSDTELVELLLINGAVRMDIGGDSEKRHITMRPGDMVQYDRNSGEIDFKAFDVRQFRPFCDNRSIHFFNLSLADIASDLTRLFGKKILILDEDLAKNRFFAYFTNNETLMQILNSLNYDSKMKIEERGSVIYISSL